TPASRPLSSLVGAWWLVRRYSREGVLTAGNAFAGAAGVGESSAAARARRGDRTGSFPLSHEAGPPRLPRSQARALRRTAQRRATPADRPGPFEHRRLPPNRAREKAACFLRPE